MVSRCKKEMSRKIWCESETMIWWLFLKNAPRLPLKLFAHLCSIIKCVCDSDPARSRLTWVIDNIILECSLLTIARHKQHKTIAWRSTRWQFMGSTRWLQSTLFDWASFRLPLFCLLSCHVYYTYRFEWHWLVMPTRVGGHYVGSWGWQRCPKSEHQRKPKERTVFQIGLQLL